MKNYIVKIDSMGPVITFNYGKIEFGMRPLGNSKFKDNDPIDNIKHLGGSTLRGINKINGNLYDEIWISGPAFIKDENNIPKESNFAYQCYLTDLATIFRAIPNFNNLDSNHDLKLISKLRRSVMDGYGSTLGKQHIWHELINEANMIFARFNSKDEMQQLSNHINSSNCSKPKLKI